MITVVVADDLLALVVFALVYSDSIDVMALIRAAGLFALAVRAAARLEHPGSAFASSAKAHAGAPARGRREHQDPRSRPTNACSSSWTSYVIVPPFALAKCGHRDRRRPLERAGDSPTAIGVHVGYVGGKPFGLVAAAGASAGGAFPVPLLGAPSTTHSARTQSRPSWAAPGARLLSRGWCSPSPAGWRPPRIDACPAAPSRSSTSNS